MNEQAPNQTHQHELETFTWDEVQNELDYAKENQLEADTSDFIFTLAANIDTIHSGGMTIPGTDEWIPGKATHYFRRTDSEGNTSSEEIPEALANQIKQFASTYNNEQVAAASSVAETQEVEQPKTKKHAETPKQDKVVKADDLASEYEGAYSSLGNRHTYKITQEGKKVVVKRADAIKAAENFGTTKGLVTPNVLAIPQSLPTPVGLTAPKGFEAPTGFSAPEGFAAPEALHTPIGLEAPINQIPASRTLPTPRANGRVTDWSAPRAEDAVQLDSDYFAAQVEQDPAPKRTLRERIKNALFTATPASLIDSFNYRRQQAGEAPVSRKRLFALGGLTLAAVGVYAAHKAGMFDHALDNMNNLWEGNKPASTPSQDTLANAANALGGAGSKASTTSAVAGAMGGVVPKPSTVNAVAEQLNNSSVNTFVVEKPWAVGNPTAWSWAESQGIPKQNVSGFLREIMGANWQEQARGMNVGDSISATAEQIAKFKTIG